MAYVKLFEAEPDTPIGFQTINKLTTNCELHRDALAARHGVGVQPGPIGPNGYLQPPWRLSPFKSFGRHDDVRIARAVATVYLAEDGSPFIQWANAQILGVERTATGVYLVRLGGITNYSAYVQAVQATVPTGSVIRWASCVPFYPPADSTDAPGIYVFTWKRDGGVSFVPELVDEFGFTLTIHGQVD